jgi:hypothetical protein
MELCESGYIPKKLQDRNTVKINEVKNSICTFLGYSHGYSSQSTYIYSVIQLLCHTISKYLLLLSPQNVKKGDIRQSEETNYFASKKENAAGRSHVTEF